MEYHLNRKLKLKTDIEHKSLYKWAINEVLENGKVAERDQIPWVWSQYFTATECSINDSFKIEKDYSNKSDEIQTKASERLSIDMRLKSGSPRHEGDWRQTKFSMFGTDRIIKDIRLSIYPITNPDEEESCRAWGCVSYTSEVDFRTDTQDDILIFNMFVKAETFTRYASIVRAGHIDEIIFSAGGVCGFYSDWSPSITTDSVKVLAPGKEQEVDTTVNPEINLPRLGLVGESSLRINRSLTLRKPEAELTTDEREPVRVDDDASHDRMVPPAVAVTDPQVRQLLLSLKKAAWWVVALLVVIALRTLLR